MIQYMIRYMIYDMIRLGDNEHMHTFVHTQLLGVSSFLYQLGLDHS